MEAAHMDESAALKVADAIRNKGGMFIGTTDWYEATGVTADEYHAFFDYAVRYAAQLDYKDANADMPCSLSTKAIVDKFTGDAKKVTLSLTIDPHHYGDVAKVQQLIGEPLDVTLAPVQMPLPLDDEGVYVPDGMEAAF